MEKKNDLQKHTRLISVMHGWNRGSGSHPSEESPFIACYPPAPEIARLSGMVGGR